MESVVSNASSMEEGEYETFSSEPEASDFSGITEEEEYPPWQIAPGGSFLIYR